MRDPWEWQETDIDELIRGKVQESLTLDYKAGAALSRTEQQKTEMCKDVSAFANSAGGTLVYGIPEDKQTHEPLDPDGCDPSVIGKEWIEQVINSGIQRRIDGVRIAQLSHSSVPGRCIYVVYVPQSFRAPHMARDHRYYRRFNFQSIPMEDYEVRDVARRQETPDLELRLRFYTDEDMGLPEGQYVTPGVTAKERLGPINLMPSLINHASTPAEYISVLLSVDTRVTIESVGDFTMAANREEIVTQGFPQGKYSVSTLLFNWGIADRMPLWAGMRPVDLSGSPIQLTLPLSTGSPIYFLRTEAQSPRTEPKITEYALEQSELFLRIRRI